MNRSAKRIIHQRYTPTLSTWDVARKSFVGENATLVATLDVRNASMRRLVGISNVRITESKDVAISQRASGEKAFAGGKLPSEHRRRTLTYHIQDFVLESFELSDYPSRLDV